MTHYFSHIYKMCPSSLPGETAISYTLLNTKFKSNTCENERIQNNVGNEYFINKWQNLYAWYHRRAHSQPLN